MEEGRGRGGFAEDLPASAQSPPVCTGHEQRSSLLSSAGSAIPLSTVRGGEGGVRWREGRCIMQTTQLREVWTYLATLLFTRCKEGGVRSLRLHCLKRIQV